MGDNVFKITPKIEELSELCVEDDLINPELYQKFDVKRGLRDINGKGVLAGLTNISDVHAKDIIDGKEIHNGDIMGINDDGIAAVGKNLTETTLELLSTMADEDSELICLYYGADVTKDDADTLSDAIEDKFPECEVEVNFGGQPIYYYMISVE